MANPAVRIRALALLLAITGGAWGVVAALDGPRYAGFDRTECRELAGLPVAPDCPLPITPFDRTGATP